MLGEALLPVATEFVFLPDPVDMGFVGTGSAVGGVAGGLWAYFFGYSLEEIAQQAAAAAVAVGVFAAAIWVLGMSGLDLLA